MQQSVGLDVVSLLKRYTERIEEILKEEIPEGVVPFVSDGVWYQFSSGGKRIRPALCMLTCEALGGDPAKAIYFALAAEILHNYLLVHDDIEDGDTIRRDRKTLWAHLGIPNAINVADYMIAKAYRIILRSPLPPKVVLELLEVFTETFERTVEGQALDINWRGKEDLTVADYFRIVQLKTAHYLTFNLVGGALAAGWPLEKVGALWELGRHLGPAFQIRDDVIDLTHGKGRGGEVGCDIREGKPSVLFAYVLERRLGATDERRRLVETIRKSREQTTEADVKWVIALYERVGALRFAQDEAQRLLASAFGVIDQIPMEESHRGLFRAISQFMIDRSS